MSGKAYTWATLTFKLKSIWSDANRKPQEESAYLGYQKKLYQQRTVSQILKFLDTSVLRAKICNEQFQLESNVVIFSRVVTKVCEFGGCILLILQHFSIRLAIFLSSS